MPLLRYLGVHERPQSTPTVYAQCSLQGTLRLGAFSGALCAGSERDFIELILFLC